MNDVLHPDTTGSHRRLAAVLVSDMVGYSRLMQIDTLYLREQFKLINDQIILPLVKNYNGQVIKTMGDGHLLKFNSIHNTVNYALNFQQSVNNFNKEIPEEKKIYFRIGINLGEVIFEENDIFGDAVNIASRLEGQCKPRKILISKLAYECLDSKAKENFEFLETKQLKNISNPVDVYVCKNLYLEKQLGNNKEKLLPSLVVLPFANNSNDEEQNYLAEGISEDLISGLIKFKNLSVEQLSMENKVLNSKSILDIFNKLKVDYIVQGSLRKSSSRIRININLIESRNKKQIWSEKYDGKIDDIFDFQDEVTTKILSSINSELTLFEIDQTLSKRTKNFDAWQYYLKALNKYYKMNKSDHSEAVKLLQKSIKLDNNFQLSHITLARCYINSAFHAWGSSAKEDLECAEKLILEALKIDKNNAFAFAVYGLQKCINRLFSEAEELLNSSLELNPNLHIAYTNLIPTYAFQGKFSLAQDAFEKAMNVGQKDPDKFFNYIGIMHAYFSNKDYEECINSANKAIILQPNFYGGYFIKASALANQNKVNESRETLKKGMILMPRLTLSSTLRNPMYEREDDISRLIKGLEIAGLR